MVLISDPTQIDWGNEKEEEPDVPPPTLAAPVLSPAAPVQTFKCTALYSYTVNSISHSRDFAYNFYFVLRLKTKTS